MDKYDFLSFNYMFIYYSPLFSESEFVTPFITLISKWCDLDNCPFMLLKSIGIDTTDVCGNIWVQVGLTGTDDRPYES